LKCTGEMGCVKRVLFVFLFRVFRVFRGFILWVNFHAGDAMNETTRLLRDLVALPSINPMGRPLQGPDIFEYRVTAYLEEFCRGLGVPCERQPVAPLRDNLVARCTLPGARRTLLLEVHQDTVPVDNMIIEPFAARVENGRLFGRGACDVKGGMAAMLAAERYSSAKSRAETASSELRIG